MENKDAAYWKERYESQEQLYVSLMTDLENYRSLVHLLKKETVHLKCCIDYSEHRANKLEKSLRATLFEETIHEYYNQFTN
jgi:hypothetical protein